MTAAGRVELVRRSMRCPRCGLTAYPVDTRVGIDGFLRPQAERLACLAAATWSLDIASDRLRELAGVRLDDETIRRHGHRAAAKAAPATVVRSHASGVSGATRTATSKHQSVPCSM